MADPTDADVELVARALEDEISAALTWGETKDVARAVLSALSASGRLTPAGGETGAEHNLRFRNGSGRWITDDDLTSAKPEDDWSHTRRLFGADVHQVTRTVTTWPDGTKLIGPWQPAEEGT